MQRLAAIILASAMVTGPAMAQTPFEPPPADQEQPGDLESDIEHGLQGFMEKLLKDVQPHLDQLGRDLNDTVNSFAPVLDELKGMMDDVGNYQTPERLENGDILIRRRADAPPPPPIGNTLRDFLAPNQQPPADSLPPAPEAAPSPDQPEPLPDPDATNEIEL
ncbi:hypothetical protein ACEUZ9_000115 [Paracoccus litorisediminis]|jgi:hypothetical protein|uniref:AAA+ family ATPase n=1 Tax=Paracoccus litorisediminis TaxID=2006130 RepID=A0A844HXW9_9RHOB|nr:hypothetical protein [Paracoccus litorisediminis]MTH62302.1 hypothetical protein [Paracoccus litorisediminis]